MRKILLLAGLFTSLGLFAAGGKEVIRHRIQPRETVFRISLMYNSTVNDIVHANPGINPKILAEGALIKVPKNTKMRDAAFVESFLNGQPEYGHAAAIIEYKPAMKKASAEIPTPTPTQVEIKQEIATTPKKESKEIPVPASTPAEPENTSAELKVNIIGTPAKAEDENPFLTPSEPRSGPSASDEQPIKEEKITEPASAEGQETGEENPFMAPKHKTEAKKPVVKSGTGATSSTPE